MALAAVDHPGGALAFFGLALARGLLNPAVAGYVNRRIESGTRATTLSVQNLASNLILACAWPLGGVVADAIGLPAVFLALACATLVLGGAAFLLWDRAEHSDAARAAPERLQSDRMPAAAEPLGS